MKRWLVYIGALVVLSSGSPSPAASRTDEEQGLIRTLQSKATPAEKDAACARLKLIGTARSVPALAALLTDEQLSHSARYALEAIHLAEAETALLNGLDKTRGLTKIGIINSLAVRGEPRAVPALAVLARNSDAAISVAATKALGQIGGSTALKSLQELAWSSTGPVHGTAIDALLTCANRTLVSGQPAKAVPIFQKIYNATQPEHIRLAAFRGLIIASGNDGLRLMTKAIESGPTPEQEAALQLVRDVQARDATKTLARLLPNVGLPVQISLVEGLAQRGDPAAVSDLAALASSAAPEVRLTILDALRSLGDASAVPLLVDFAASGNAAEQSAARLALATLHRGQVTDALLSQLANEAPGVQAEITRALGNRGDRAAVPRLFDLAQQTNDSVRGSALKALAELVQPQELSDLIQIVVSTKDPAARTETAEALNSACQRLTLSRRELPVSALLSGINAGSPDARAALLPICSGLAQPDSRLALRTALEDANSQVKTAALRALCDTVDPDLLEDLVTVALTTKAENLRNLAIAGGVRVATQEEGAKISRDRQVTVLKALLQTASTPAQKRMVLAGLGETPVLDALNLVDPLVEDPGVHNEAARAAIKIGTALPSMQSQEALTVLNKALAAATDDQTRKALQGAISRIGASADYITDWQVAGPYRQTGKDYAALFEAIFPAEMGEGQGATWRPLPAGTDVARPWVMDLLKTVGGEQCVAYARTWIHSEQDQPARLELGSDDGVKVWLNDKQVYALNTARVLTPGSDKIDVALHSGWNRLLLKITQNNQGWEFCARFVKPDGSHLAGLQCGSVPKP